MNISFVLAVYNKLDLTKIRLNQFLLNLKDENGQPVNLHVPEKEIYDYDDILALDIIDKKFLINNVLGQKFFIITNEYPFVCDPFKVTQYDSFIEKAARKSLTTLNSHLLLFRPLFALYLLLVLLL